MLIHLLLQAGDFVSLRTEMKRFMLQDAESTDIDSVVMIKLWNGESLMDKKDKKIIIKCSEGTIACGLSK